MRPEFGNPKHIKLRKQGELKDAHANCDECDGTLVRTVTCEECGGDGTLEVECTEVQKR